MEFSHINVEEAVQIKDAAKAKQAVPIHWGTFPLTIEPILEPKEKLFHSMKHREDRDSFVPWLIGETKGF
jgi:N-acyl-phosphatidylethanolamine-hydrolysing phospholipase D